MFYKIVRAVFWLYMKLVFRLRIIGWENIPEQGAVLICANHFSNYDPFVLALSTKREVHFLAKKELFVNPFSAKVFKWLNAIPVDRESADLKSYKAVMKDLKNENAVGIFIQGTRKASREEGKGGAALFALKSGAALVPVGISGSYKPFTEIRVRIGKPLDLQSYLNQKIRTEDVNRVTAQIMKEINGMVSEV